MALPTVHGKTHAQLVAEVMQELNLGSGSATPNQQTPGEQALRAIFLQLATVLLQLYADMQALRAALGASYTQPAFGADTSQNPIP